MWQAALIKVYCVDIWVPQWHRKVEDMKLRMKKMACYILADCAADDIRLFMNMPRSGALAPYTKIATMAIRRYH